MPLLQLAALMTFLEHICLFALIVIIAYDCLYCISTADYGAALDRGHPKKTKKRKRLMCIN